MDVKKIIITGAPRTGTTVLTTLLCSAPNILVTNELGIFDYNPDNFYSKKDVYFKDRVNKPLLKLKGLSEKNIEDSKRAIRFVQFIFSLRCRLGRISTWRTGSTRS